MSQTIPLLQFPSSRPKWISLLPCCKIQVSFTSTFYFLQCSSRAHKRRCTISDIVVLGNLIAATLHRGKLAHSISFSSWFTSLHRVWYGNQSEREKETERNEEKERERGQDDIRRVPIEINVTSTVHVLLHPCRKSGRRCLYEFTVLSKIQRPRCDHRLFS